MISTTFKVPEETTNYLQRLQYEVSGSRDIIVFMLTNNMSTDSDSFKSFKTKYDEAYSLYEIAKSKFDENFLTPVRTLPEGTYSWNIDFDSSMCTVMYEGSAVTEEELSKLFD